MKELPRELIHCRKRLVIYVNLVVLFFLFIIKSCLHGSEMNFGLNGFKLHVI